MRKKIQMEIKEYQHSLAFVEIIGEEEIARKIRSIIRDWVINKSKRDLGLITETQNVP